MCEPDNALVEATATQPGPHIGLASYARTVARVVARTGKAGLGREELSTCSYSIGVCHVGHRN